MTEHKLEILLQFEGRDAVLTIFGETANDAAIEQKDAAENGEAPYQIKEGCFYEYSIPKEFLLETNEIVSRSKVNPSSGRISPNIYVGTLAINILDSATGKKCGVVNLEVQSVKTSYREDYRHMLEEITEKCHDLLLQHSSVVTQTVEPDYEKDPKTTYQRFAFVKSIVDSQAFADSVHKILSAPVTKWKETKAQRDIRSVRRFSNGALRQIAGASNRIALPCGHQLKSRMDSIPAKIRFTQKSETVDTPENRFIKHALTTFLFFIGSLRNEINETTRLSREASLVEDQLLQMLSHSVFKEISLPITLSLNSPVLQRKEGYREILRVWLMFDVAAKLVWHGGPDVYGAGKRDVAVLYEYWLFFKLLDLVREVFKIEPASIEQLIEPTEDGLGLKLKQGQHLPVKGIYDSETRKLHVEFSYNKTFSGGKEYPESGSWTRNLRPDYTLSIWTYGIGQEQAENEELIVHIHFDAKYKIENLTSIFSDSGTLDGEKEEQKQGTYKRADLLKMHTYRDAIRRTAGAYVLYPGDKSDNKHGFHELLPGLGAFAIKPSGQNNGTEKLKSFLNEVVQHFLNRASQRETMSLKTYETHKDKPDHSLAAILPETFGANRDLLPDQTFVLVGFYKDQEHLDWIVSKKLYNTRTGTKSGSLRLNTETTSAKYLLLHTHGVTETSRFFKLNTQGPKIFSGDDMKTRRYPKSNPEGYYIVFDIAETGPEIEFDGLKWDIKKLQGWQSGRGSALPFTVSLTELMKAVVKK